MMREFVSAGHAVRFLNELARLDPVAMLALVGQRVPCNQAIVDHPTVQVTDHAGHPEVGLLGVLNGLFGVFDEGPQKGWGGIGARFTPGKPETLSFYLQNEQGEKWDPGDLDLGPVS